MKATAEHGALLVLLQALLKTESTSRRTVCPPVLPRRNPAQILSRTDHPSAIALQKTMSHHEMAMITNGISMRGVRVEGYNPMLQMALMFPNRSRGQNGGVLLDFFPVGKLCASVADSVHVSG